MAKKKKGNFLVRSAVSLGKKTGKSIAEAAKRKQAEIKEENDIYRKAFKSEKKKHIHKKARRDAKKRFNNDLGEDVFGKTPTDDIDLTRF